MGYVENMFDKQLYFKMIVRNVIETCISVTNETRKTYVSNHKHLQFVKLFIYRRLSWKMHAMTLQQMRTQVEILHKCNRVASITSLQLRVYS